MRKFNRITAGLLCSSMLAPAAWGQEAEEDADVTVLAPIVVTASSIATTVQDAPASISVIDGETVAEKGGRDLTDALRVVPGLNVGFGSDGTKGISIRGLSSGYTLILVDGKRVNASNSFLRHYNGDLDWVPTDAIEKIEVVRGPMSTLYGSDAMGGVVNIITKKGTDVWTGSLTTATDIPEHSDTGESRSITGYLSGPLARNLTLSAWGNYKKKDPNEDVANADGTAIDGAEGTKNTNGNVRLDWSPTDAQRWEFEGGYDKQDYLAGDDTDGSSTVVRRNTLSARNVTELGWATWTSTLAYEKARNWSASSVSRGSVVPESTISYETLTFETLLNSEAQVGGRLLQYTLGASAMREEIDDPVNLGQDDPTTGAATSPSASVDTSALFAELRYELTDRASLTGGLRIDHHEEFGTHASPRLYLNYALTDSLMLKAGWAQAFKAPDLRQTNPGWGTRSRGRGCQPFAGPCWMVGNPDLQPETSDTYEIGLNYQGANGVDAELTYFRNDIEDMIAVVGPSLGTIDIGGVDYAIYERGNIDTATTSGFEGGLSLPLTDTLTWRNTFTYIMESEQEYKTPEGATLRRPLSATPEISATSELMWAARHDLDLSATVTHVGKQVEFENADTLSSGSNVEAYTMVGLGATYTPADNVTVRAAVRNLFNEQPDFESGYREDGRLFALSLTTSF